jgi:hypothetical protein
MAATATHRPSRSLSLWFGVLAGPILWFVQLNVNYQWEEFLACSPSATDRGVVLGVGVRTLVVIVNALVAAVTVAALVVARGLRRADGPIARWMARAGIINSVLFLILIVVGFAPALILETCQTPL